MTHIFCSTIIATIDRPTLNRAVRSALDQNFTAADFEVIVVNDSGQPLSPADWQSDDRVHVLHTSQRERCIARNTGAAIARGRYLHFLDDDDFLLPGAYENLFAFSETQPGAGWLYGGTQLVDRAGNPLVQLRHQLTGNGFTLVMAGEWIPLPSSIIRAECFFAVGGFKPWALFREDIDLQRRIALQFDLAETPELISCLAIGEITTSDHRLGRVLGLAAREEILDEPTCFKRLRTSARSSYRRGRMVRVYLTSTIWNLRQRRILKAISRLMWAGAAGLLSLRYSLSASYWRAIIKEYQSPAFKPTSPGDK